MTAIPAPDSRTKRRLELAAFLRERRARLSPEDVGLTRRGRRHVKGLRRDEVAQVAGIGVSWYTLIEQGRDVNVSAETIVRIAQALRLDPFQTTHLLGLARTEPETVPRAEADPDVLARLQPILDTQRLDPAHVLDDSLSVLAWNGLAERFFGFRRDAKGFERNMLWRIFNDEAFARLFADWDEAIANLTGLLRFNYARSIDQPDYEALVYELYDHQPAFAKLWDAHHVQGRGNEVCRFVHPSAGPITMRLLYATVHVEPRLTIAFLTPLDDVSRIGLDRFERGDTTAAADAGRTSAFRRALRSQAAPG